MKRPCSLSTSTSTSTYNTRFSLSKRHKLEHEIFSTSIKDIEKMFTDEEEFNNNNRNSCGERSMSSTVASSPPPLQQQKEETLHKPQPLRNRPKKLPRRSIFQPYLNTNINGYGSHTVGTQMLNSHTGGTQMFNSHTGGTQMFNSHTGGTHGFNSHTGTQMFNSHTRDRNDCSFQYLEFPNLSSIYSKRNYDCIDLALLEEDDEEEEIMILDENNNRKGSSLPFQFHSYPLPIKYNLPRQRDLDFTLFDETSQGCENEDEKIYENYKESIDDDLLMIDRLIMRG
ncbi:hypothetical protein KGF56_002242 [Candida oxycetoniae]|uniref:Uncharacterized protein n=1 Tax=Candida oxycetoniae TaxID=497107 RepID=A0AAI9SYA4_9ASCO|nr:uncharacterized protein KGF56_002242 [Candida oxycetoniae]KAI3404991.2 hypothetical protein KGF56_002242 [Candida oxycetoniae]